MGRRHEVELVNAVEDEENLNAIKIPSSGSGTKRDLPDILIKGPHGLLAGELKYTSKRDENACTLFQSEEIKALARFSYDWGARAVLISRFSYDTGWYALEVGSPMYEMKKTRTGNIRPKRKNREEYPDLFQLAKDGEDTFIENLPDLFSA